MTSAWFVGARGPVAQDDSAVRSTVQNAPSDASAGTPAEIDTELSISKQMVDTDPTLSGLPDRQVGGDVHASVQSAPAWKPGAGAVKAGIDALNASIPLVGTAAAREDAGQFGTGTHQYQVSLTPELREGMDLGGDYFLSVDQVVQQGASLTALSPAVGDPDWNSVAQRLGTNGSRQAYQATLYQRFMDGA